MNTALVTTNMNDFYNEFDKKQELLSLQNEYESFLNAIYVIKCIQSFLLNNYCKDQLLAELEFHDHNKSRYQKTRFNSLSSSLVHWYWGSKYPLQMTDDSIHIYFSKIYYYLTASMYAMLTIFVFAFLFSLIGIPILILLHYLMYI